MISSSISLNVDTHCEISQSLKLDDDWLSERKQDKFLWNYIQK